MCRLPDTPGSTPGSTKKCLEDATGLALVGFKVLKFKRGVGFSAWGLEVLCQPYHKHNTDPQQGTWLRELAS